MINIHYRQRKNRLVKLMQDNSLAIIIGNSEYYRTESGEYNFRVNNNLFYFTGFDEPDSILIISKTNNRNVKSYLFCREKDELAEIWTGYRYGTKIAREQFNFDNTYDILSFEKNITKFLKNKQNLYFDLVPFYNNTNNLTNGFYLKIQNIILKTLDDFSKLSKRDFFIPNQIIALQNLMQKLRIIKDDEEIKLLKQAADISSNAYKAMLQKCHAGLKESNLEAELSYYFRNNDAAFNHAYSPIVASGKNACVLHYNQNNKILENGELVLVDAGCEYNNYAADITRTFPVSGKFSPLQKDIYNIVLEAQKNAISYLKIGESYITSHKQAIYTLIGGLIDLKILPKTDLETAYKEGKWQLFYMHGTSHFLGMDVHDIGLYKNLKINTKNTKNTKNNNNNNEDSWIKLEKNMVLTVEPGLYFSEQALLKNNINLNKKYFAEFKNIGIRIEDDVIINSQAEVYTTAPKTIAEIENIMAK